jgi:phthalate 4,5-cis-dihydrodiol dehydrogenase
MWPFAPHGGLEMSHSAPLRIGLVGCGRQGNALAQAIVRAEAVHLVACADPDVTAAWRAASLASEVCTFDSVEALLSGSEVDAVLIATPHHLLGPVALAAIASGKHVMAEKPMALAEYEARQIESAADVAGITYMPGYSFRFSMASFVHDLLTQGAVGEIQSITGSIGHGPMSGWLAVRETGGGPLLYVGTHLIDLALWFVSDEPVSVYADVRRDPESGTDATTALQLGFAAGVAAQFLVTQRAASFFYELHIIGNSGEIALRGHNFLQFEIEVLSNVVHAFKEPTIIRPQIQRDNISMMLVPELQEFASSIRDQRPPAITAADGRRVLRILDAVLESERSGRAIAMDSPFPVAR